MQELYDYERHDPLNCLLKTSPSRMWIYGTYFWQTDLFGKQTEKSQA